jgi:Spy/CpxP family protein refolding chaperone
MKKLSLIAALALGSLLACSTIAMAQDASANKDAKKGGKGGRMSIEQQMEKMTKDLSLTDEQKPKVEAVLKDSAKKRQEIFADTSMDRQQMREKMRPIMEEQNKKLKEILTPDQMEKYTKMQDEMKKKAGAAKKKTDQ